MSFDVHIGQCSEKGPRRSNEDCCAVRAPESADDAHGWIAAIADGVSSGGAGREAAQTTALAVVRDYAGTPETWDTTVALDRLIGAQNAWLADHNRRRQGLPRVVAHDQPPPSTGQPLAMTTLTALVLRGHAWTLAHVGDTRCWLLRDGQLTQLTQDHALEDAMRRSRLTRAVGLDEAVRVDYLQGELRVGDCFVLTSDGVHGTLSRARLAELLARLGGRSAPQSDPGAQGTAEALVEAALRDGSRDNASAIVLRVQGLPAGRAGDDWLADRDLAVPPMLRVGDRLDGYTITATIADNGVHRLYQARDGEGRLVVLKTLHPARARDPQERAMLAHEAWLSRRVARTPEAAARHEAEFVQTLEALGRSACYRVYAWHAGRTLEQWLAEKRRFSVPEIADGALAIARALARLHRLGVVHRDLKPGNLHLGEDGRWRVLDLGVAASGHEPEALRGLHAGTPSYMNPEQWQRDDDGATRQGEADARSDLYAFGVVMYQWLTGHLPYGEIEPYQTGRYRRDPKPPSRLRPEVPIWLDHVVLKAVALDARQRFETAEELVLALERGAARPLAAPGATPLIARDPALLWKIGCAVSLLFNLLLAYWLLFLPR